MTTKQRPKHLNLVKIRFPITAIASILHRLSGAMMFFMTPFLIYYFALSLQTPPGFAAAVNWINSGLMRLVMVVLLWSLIHHLLMGIRFLLVDFDIGIELSRARASAIGVTITALLVTLWMVKGLFV